MEVDFEPQTLASRFIKRAHHSFKCSRLMLIPAMFGHAVSTFEISFHDVFFRGRQRAVRYSTNYEESSCSVKQVSSGGKVSHNAWCHAQACIKPHQTFCVVPVSFGSGPVAKFRAAGRAHSRSQDRKCLLPRRCVFRCSPLCNYLLPLLQALLSQHSHTPRRF
jgi:hypothetical protein